MKTVVALQGGGPLGAFGCGAWSALAPWLRAGGHELVAVAGASIGALNAAVVACHAGREDLGAGALQSLWRDEIAWPLMPRFAPAPAFEPLLRPLLDELHAWAGWCCGVAFGNRALFAPMYAHWNPAAGLRRVVLPLYSQRRMQRLLAGIVGPGYRSEGRRAPLLAVAATDVLDGSLRLFHSDEGPVDEARLSASAAIPLMFEPVEVDGRRYCDGEVNRQSLVPELLETLRLQGRVSIGEPLQLVCVGQFSRPAGRLPRTSHELLDRSLNWMLADKLTQQMLPPSVRLIEIGREPPPQDSVSGQFDYSSGRIDALIAAGRAEALEALEAPHALRAAA